MVYKASSYIKLQCCLIVANGYVMSHESYHFLHSSLNWFRIILHYIPIIHIISILLIVFWNVKFVLQTQISKQIRCTLQGIGSMKSATSRSAGQSSSNFLASIICFSAWESTCAKRKSHAETGVVKLKEKRWNKINCRWIDQVENLIKLKQENPSLRIRSAEQLGPSISISLQQTMMSTVKGPAVYCVEPEVFAKLTGKPAPEQLVSENIDGAMMQVVSWSGFWFIWYDFSFVAVCIW